MEAALRGKKAGVEEESMEKKETVTRVIDGDTFRTSSRQKSVRLANVDAPEKGAPGSVKARDALSKMIGGKEVRIDTVARDKYGRSVAKVYVGRESVNKNMQRKLKR